MSSRSSTLSSASLSAAFWVADGVGEGEGWEREWEAGEGRRCETHRAREQALSDVVARLAARDAVARVASVLRVEGE